MLIRSLFVNLILLEDCVTITSSYDECPELSIKKEIKVGPRSPGDHYDSTVQMDDYPADSYAISPTTFLFSTDSQQQRNELVSKDRSRKRTFLTNGHYSTRSLDSI